MRVRGVVGSCPFFSGGHRFVSLISVVSDPRCNHQMTKTSRGGNKMLNTNAYFITLTFALLIM